MGFIHPLTDWGFKRIFGDKELLMDFLNSLLEGERVITDLSYLNTETQPEENDGRKTVYDLYCETDTGEYIIVEMQNRRQACFKDRKAIFDRLERIASQANLSKDERARLDEDWKNYNDFFNTMDYAKEEGRAEGRKEEQVKLAKGFKETGTPIAVIAQVTGLSIEEIEKL